VNHRKYSAGNDLSLWSSGDYAVRFVMNSDLTLSPVDSDSKLCLGSSIGGKVVLVGRNDPAKLVFSNTGNEEVERIARAGRAKEEKETEEREMMPAIAASLLTWERMAKFVGERGGGGRGNGEGWRPYTKPLTLEFPNLQQPTVLSS
jgi:hypothetical protein